MMQTDRDTRFLRAADEVGAASRLSRLPGMLALIAALLAGGVLIFGGLGGDRLNGDEHNAIAFLRDGLWDYLRSFHYSHAIKLQVWLVHNVFGDDFLWYRVPAALSAMALLVWLVLQRAPGLSMRGAGPALVVLLLGANASFLNFARWGMPIYAQAMLVGTLLVGLALADAMRAAQAGEPTRMRWTAWRLLLIAVLPWLHPAAVILAGGLTAYLVLEVLVRAGRGERKGLVRPMLSALVPAALGAASLVAFRLSMSDEHWERARGHHKALGAWLEQGGDGVAGFLWHSLGTVGRDFASMTALASDSPWLWLAPVYVKLVAAVALLCLLALAVAGWRAWRLRGARTLADATFLRGALLLWTVIGASLVVTNGAALVDAFPSGSLRHLFFLLGPAALLAMVSLAYLTALLRASLASAGGPWLTATGAGMATAAVAALAVGVAAASVQQRRLEADKYADAVDVLRAADNAVVYSASPGFYFAGQTLASQAQFLDQERNGIHALRAVVQQRQVQGGGKLAVLLYREGPARAMLAGLTRDFGLKVEREERYGPYDTVALRIPGGAEAPPRVVRSIDLKAELPATPIVSVRFDPSLLLQASARVDGVVLTDDQGDHAIDLCGDKEITLTRTTRKGEGPGCTFVFGNTSNFGWIAPSGLRNLGPSSRPRSLRVRMTGEFADEFHVYLDQGTGYRSPIRLKVPPAVAR